MSEQEVKKYPNWNRFWVWLTAYPFRWTRLAFGGALLITFIVIINELTPNVEVPSEAFWVTIGVIVGAFANAMTAPDPSKSEVLTLAEKVIDKLEKK